MSLKARIERFGRVSVGGTQSVDDWPASKRPPFGSGPRNVGLAVRPDPVQHTQNRLSVSEGGEGEGQSGGVMPAERGADNSPTKL